MKARPHVTLEDVARSANVSLATASRVLNGTASVRADLRERVSAAAAELAYAPNAHAQALAGGTHRTVGVICHDVSDPYFAAIAGGVMRVATDNGLLVMLAGTFRDPDREVAYVSTLRAQRAAAILLIGSAFEDRAWERAMAAELEPYRRGGGQVAAVSRHRGLKIDTVQPDNKGGAAALAKELVGLGHKRFAVLAGPRRLSTVIDRLAGFSGELAAHGIELREDDVIEAAFSRDGGYEATKRLLAGRKRKLPTCLFAVTDVMAIGALTALREEGLSVPGDISVVGYDNSALAAFGPISLTSVDQDGRQMGANAARLLVDRITERDRRTVQVKLSPTLVVRRTSAPPSMY